MDLIDTHAHLEMVKNLDDVLVRAKESGVTKIISIGTSIEASKKCIEIADSTAQKLRGDNENFPEVYATCGIHPEDGKADLDKFGGDYIQELEKVTRSSKKVVAIGECGLDYHLTSDTRPTVAKALAGKPVTSDGEKEFQKELFATQIKLAVKLGLPLVVHCRNAWDEIFDLIDSQSSTLKSNSMGAGLNPVKGVFHSWTGNIEAAKKALELGFYISFSGIVTFGNAKDIQNAATSVPIERILVETDSPFLAPEPIRGSQNESANVKITADFLASLLSMRPDDLYAATAENARKLFGI